MRKTLAITALALVLAACGGSDSGSTDYDGAVMDKCGIENPDDIEFVSQPEPTGGWGNGWSVRHYQLHDDASPYSVAHVRVDSNGHVGPVKCL